jgi:redox-sensitive bicupin YhaK (pirin superfamily)
LCRIARATSPATSRRHFLKPKKRGRLRLIASPDGADSSVTIHQDAKLDVSLLSPGQQVEHALGSARFGWLQVAKGSVELNGKTMKQGDGATADEPRLLIKPPKKQKYCCLI